MSLQTTARKLRHCMVVYAAYPFFETRVQREAEALIARGHEVDVICPVYQDEPAVDEHEGVHIYRVKLPWQRKKNLSVQFLQYIRFLVLAALKLTSLDAKRHYDAVQTHNLPDFLVFAAAIPKWRGAKVILDLHDLMPEFFLSRFEGTNNKVFSRLVYLQERISCRFADHVITVTEHWRQSLIQRGVPAGKCSVVMNLADTRVFHQVTPEEAKQKDPDKFCLFYHGDMPQRYGLDLVLQAIALLREKIPNIHFRLVGGGVFLDTLKTMTSDLDLQNCVEFLGGQPVENLPALIATADVAVVPYRNDIFTDSLMPTKLMEYAVEGIPTIAAKTTAIAAYFEEGMVQFFAPGSVDDLARCILLLYREPERRAALVKGILSFNARYNWQDASTAYVEGVEKLCLKRTRA